MDDSTAQSVQLRGDIDGDASSRVESSVVWHDRDVNWILLTEVNVIANF
jgi:hypothetical protein